MGLSPRPCKGAPGSDENGDQTASEPSHSQALQWPFCSLSRMLSMPPVILPQLRKSKTCQAE